MKQLFKIIPFLIIFSVFWIGNTFAISLTPYIDVKNKFQFAYPSSWKLNKKEPNYKIQVLNKDETAIFGIMIYELKKKADPGIFIGETEKILNVKNQLPENETKLSPDMLKFIGADDSRIGVYTIGDKDAPVLQKIYVLSKGSKIFVLGTTLVKSEENRYMDSMDIMFHSFSLK